METIIKVIAGVVIFVLLIGLALVFFVPQLYQVIHSFGKQTDVMQKQRQQIEVEVAPSSYITDDMSTIEKIGALFEYFDLDYRWYGDDSQRDYGYFNITFKSDEGSIFAPNVVNTIDNKIFSWYKNGRNVKMSTATPLLLGSASSLCTGNYHDDATRCPPSQKVGGVEYPFVYCKENTYFCKYCMNEYEYNVSGDICYKSTQQPKAAPAYQPQQDCYEPKYYNPGPSDEVSCGDENGFCGKIYYYTAGTSSEFSSPVKIYVYMHLNNDYGYIPYVSVCQG